MVSNMHGLEGYSLPSHCQTMHWSRCSANNEQTVSAANSSVSRTIHLVECQEHLLAVSEVPTLRLCDLYVCTKTCDGLVHIVIGERHVLDIVIHTENVGRSLGITLQRVEQLQRNSLRLERMASLLTVKDTVKRVNASELASLCSAPSPIVL
jgi:hypothetical protein